MSNKNSEDQTTNVNTPPAKGPRGKLIAIAIGWNLCLIAIIFGLFQWRTHNLQSTAVLESQVDDEGDGRSQKKIVIGTDKDGGMIAREVTDDSKDDPWDVDGIGDFSFTDTGGKTVSKSDLLGKPFVIAFVFTNCRGPCPKVTEKMREVQDRLKEYDFNLVTLTVDPQNDTLDVLANYGRSTGANFDRWRFLTGDQAEIYGLIHNSFKMPVREAVGPERQPGFEIIHSTNIMLVNDQGRVVGKFNAMMDEEIVKLSKELKRLASPIGKSQSGKEGLK